MARCVKDLLSVGLENSMFKASCIADKNSLLVLAERSRQLGPWIMLNSTTYNEQRRISSDVRSLKVDKLAQRKEDLNLFDKLKQLST